MTQDIEKLVDAYGKTQFRLGCAAVPVPVWEVTAARKALLDAFAAKDAELAEMALLREIEVKADFCPICSCGLHVGPAAGHQPDCRLGKLLIRTRATTAAPSGLDGEVDRLTKERDLAQSAAEDYDKDCIDMRYQRDAAESALAAMTERCRVLEDGLVQIKNRNWFWQSRVSNYGKVREPGEFGNTASETLRRAAAVLTEKVVPDA